MFPPGSAHGFLFRVRMDYPTSARLLEQLDIASGGTLTRRDDLALLLALGESEARRRTLAALSFHAKAAHRIHGVMRRIGQDGDGYEKLQKEFGLNVERTTNLLSELLREAPDDVARHLQENYLTMTQTSIENLLALMSDLSWYKNWLIDARQDGGGRP